MTKKRYKLLFYFIVFLISTDLFSQTINEASGWIESAFVKWQPVDNAESYNVYYSGEGITNKKIDNQLIRDYGDYFRADILGLKAGTYTIKVIPVKSGEEGTGTESGSLTVTAHDRTGFAFSNGHVPGAYKADGTLKDGAVILYITQNTKNTVSLEVIGADDVPCVGLEQILEGFKKGKDSRPLIIRLVGQITDLEYMEKGDIVIDNKNNTTGHITLEGVGDDAVADGWGIRVKNAVNIEIRNIGLMNCNSSEGDDIGLQQNNQYIWVHHCDFFYGMAGGDADQAKGDGALDSKTSGFVTFSYNHFWDTGKSNLLGNGTESPEYLTYHHNWYDHSDSRHPRVRNHSVHVYNNYYDGNSKYGIGATMSSSVFVEANYFRNCKFPMLISMQGSDVFDEDLQANDYSDMPTFSKEDGGIIKAYNNYMTGQRRFVSYGMAGYPNSTVDFDAYVASSRDEIVNTSVVTYQGSHTYNNFDTDPVVMYSYVPDSPEKAKENAVKYAGRMNGGDFKWTFDNAVDDESYDVNTGLKAALVGYQTSLVAIQGDSATTGGGDPGTTEGDIIHNFTLSGLTSTFFNISGNLSDSKGTVNYDGLVLTQCLKIESSTSISFTTTDEATLTLVFNADFNGEIKINGTSYSVSAGILTITLPAGNYEITKTDTSNLYYMSLVYKNTNGIYDTYSDNIRLYPNPAVNTVHISGINNIKKIQIYSLTGILMKDISENINTIEINNLVTGTYMVIVNTEHGVFKQILIKK